MCSISSKRDILTLKCPIEHGIEQIGMTEKRYGIIKNVIQIRSPSMVLDDSNLFDGELIIDSSDLQNIIK